MWEAPWSFYNSCYLVLFCLDLSWAGGVAVAVAVAAAAKVITRLATSPQILCSLPSSPLSSQFPLPSNLGGLHYGFLMPHIKGRAQVSAVGLAHVLTVWPSAAPPWGHPWNVTDRRIQQGKLTFCVSCSLSVCQYLLDLTQRNIVTPGPVVSCVIAADYFCLAALVAHMLRQIFLHSRRAGIIFWLLFNWLWNHQVSFADRVHGQISLSLLGVQRVSRPVCGLTLLPLGLG